jgi:predicted site-specific integrase-resolvase
MAETLEEAKKKLDDEYGQVRRKFDKIHEAFDRVASAGPEDDLYERLKDLEKVVKEVRDGGIVGSGANGHRRALKEYEKLKSTPS